MNGIKSLPKKQSLYHRSDDLLGIGNTNETFPLSRGILIDRKILDSSTDHSSTI